MGGFFGGTSDFQKMSGDWADVFGTGAAKAANAANYKRYKQALGIWDQLQGQQSNIYNQAQGLLGQSLATIRSGYGAAANSLAGSGTTAKQGILAREKQSTASSQQSLIDRGLYGSTTLDAAQRGISYDASQQMSAVDETIGRMMSELQVGQTQAESGALKGMAAFQQQRYQSLSDMLGGKIGTITSRQDVAGQSIASQIGPIIAMMAML